MCVVISTTLGFRHRILLVLNEITKTVQKRRLRYYVFQHWCNIRETLVTFYKGNVLHFAKGRAGTDTRVLRTKREMMNQYICSNTYKSTSQIKHQLDATLCRFYFCRVTLHVSGVKRPSSGVLKNWHGGSWYRRYRCR